MPLRGVVGHHRVIDLLARAVEGGTLPPSMIFAGPEGVGKHRVAVALGQVLNCPHPVRTGHEDTAPEGQSIDSRTSGLPPFDAAQGARSASRGADFRTPYDACGACAVCRRIERGHFADVITVGLEGSATIGVDAVREVVLKATYRPYEGRRRVVIIDPADMMERFAQNALLKVLEETPPATVFVLVTSRPDVLLPTVRSRCPQIRFGVLDVAELTEVLVRECAVPEREARAAAAVASGSVVRAMEAASEEAGEARGQALEVLRDAASARDRRTLGEQIKETLGLEKKSGGGKTGAGEREGATLLLRALASLLRDLALLGWGAGQTAPGVRPAASSGRDDDRLENGRCALANADLTDDLQRLAPSYNRQRAMRAFAAVDDALGALARNVSAKLVIDWLGYRI